MIHDKIDVLVKDFSNLKDWDNKYKYIIKLGQKLPKLEDSFYDEKNIVKGCQSQVWMHAKYIKDNNSIELVGDSDALIVKGLVAVLLNIYSGESPQSILDTPPDFIADIGLSSYLSPNRANGFYAMVKQIMLYATAFKALNQ